MANRNIDSEIWNDSKFADEFSPEDKYFWLMLLTTRYGNLSGCFSFTISQMSKDSGYDENSIKIILGRFINKYKVVDYDFETKEILIFNWSKYNWTRSPKFQIVMAKYISKIKSVQFKDYVEKSYEQYRIDTVSIPYRYHTSSIRESVSSSNSIRDSISDSESVRNVQAPTSPTVECVKTVYGKFKNVQLTDDQYHELQVAYPSLYQDYIDRLDRHIGKTGRTYQDHFIVIDSWINEDKKKDDGNNKGDKVTADNNEMTDEQYAKLLKELKQVDGEGVSNNDHRRS